MLRLELLGGMNWAAGEGGGLLRKSATWLDTCLRKIILAAYEGWIGRGLNCRQEEGSKGRGIYVYLWLIHVEV